MPLPISTAPAFSPFLATPTLSNTRHPSALTHSPQTFSRGNRCCSINVTAIPLRAKSSAATLPPGPPPTTDTESLTPTAYASSYAAPSVHRRETWASDDLGFSQKCFQNRRFRFQYFFAKRLDMKLNGGSDIRQRCLIRVPLADNHTFEPNRVGDKTVGMPFNNDFQA